MSRANLKGIGRATLWGSVAINLAAVGLNLRDGNLGVMGWSTIIVVALVAWLQLAPKVEARLDA